SSWASAIGWWSAGVRARDCQRGAREGDMPRQVREILGLLGAKQAAAVQVYPLHAGAAEPSDSIDAPLDREAIARARAWASVWGADHGRLTAAITPAEK